jgi:hypothetical protein
MPIAMMSTGHKVSRIHQTFHEMNPVVLPRNTSPMRTVPTPSKMRCAPHPSWWSGVTIWMKPPAMIRSGHRSHHASPGTNCVARNTRPSAIRNSPSPMPPPRGRHCCGGPDGGVGAAHGEPAYGGGAGAVPWGLLSPVSVMVIHPSIRNDNQNVTTHCYAVNRILGVFVGRGAPAGHEFTKRPLEGVWRSPRQSPLPRASSGGPVASG